MRPRRLVTPTTAVSARTRCRSWRARSPTALRSRSHAAAEGLGELLNRIANGYGEKTPSGGVHLLWRCAEIEGNLKLARRPATPAELLEDPDDLTKVLFETRG